MIPLILRLSLIASGLSYYVSERLGETPSLIPEGQMPILGYALQFWVNSEVHRV